MEDQEKDKLSGTTLTALCVSLKIQVSGILFNNLEAAAHPLPTVPPCHNLGAPAWSTHLRSFSPRKPAGPVRAMAPTCGSSPHQAADSDLSSSFNFSSFKFLNFKLLCFQVDKLSSQARSHIPD